VQEVLGALRVVKAFGRETYEQARFARRSEEGLEARIRYEAAEGIFAFVIGMSVAAGTAAVLYVGFHQVQSGAVTLGELLLVVSYLALLYEPLRTISEIVGRLQLHLASAERAFAFLDELPDVPQLPDARRLARVDGAFHDGRDFRAWPFRLRIRFATGNKDTKERTEDTEAHACRCVRADLCVLCLDLRVLVTRRRRPDGEWAGCRRLQARAGHRVVDAAACVA